MERSSLPLDEMLKLGLGESDRNCAVAECRYILDSKGVGDIVPSPLFWPVFINDFQNLICRSCIAVRGFFIPIMIRILFKPSISVMLNGAVLHLEFVHKFPMVSRKMVIDTPGEE